MSNSISNGLYCNNCKEHTNYVCTECALVCTECGFEHSEIGVHIDEVIDFGFIKSSNYKRIVYFRKHVREILKQHPTIPDDLFELIENEAWKEDEYGPIRGFTRIHVREILRRIKVPESLQKEYKSVPRPQNRYKETLMTKMTKFTKWWRYIIWRLDNDVFIPDGDSRLWLTIGTMFLQAERAHQIVKDDDKKSIINMYLLIIKLMQIFDLHNGTTWCKEFSKWLPLPSWNKALPALQVFRRMCEYENWIDIKKFPQQNSGKHPFNTYMNQKTITIGGYKTEDGRTYKRHFKSYFLCTK